jgi:hypothetical protein
VTGVKALAFTGADGGRDQDADLEIGGPIVTMSTRRPLGFREGLTAVVGWDKGFVQEPDALDQIPGFFVATGRWAFPSLSSASCTPNGTGAGAIPNDGPSPWPMSRPMT